METISALHLICRALCKKIFIIKKSYLMLPEKIMQSDFIDLLFENRNKSYGAYALRRSYNKTLLYATSFTFFIAAVFSVLQFIQSKNGFIYASQIVFMSDQELVKVNIPKCNLSLLLQFILICQ